jgi:hypothetical protein
MLFTVSVLFFILVDLFRHVTSAQAPFLEFPLPDRTSNTAVINTAFDHSMSQ